MSRTVLDGFPLGDVEKDFMLGLIQRYTALTETLSQVNFDPVARGYVGRAEDSGK